MGLRDLHEARSDDWHLRRYINNFTSQLFGGGRGGGVLVSSCIQRTK